MTTTLPFGAALAFAEQTMTAVLRQHLAERRTAPETWYALQLVTLRGPRVTRADLTEALENSRTLNAGTVRELLARLEAEDLIHGGTEVELTPDGIALHRDLREYISGPTAELLGRFDPADIETTVRTLQAITKAAAEDLAPAG